MLDELDWELKRRGHRFVRYADDRNIYVRSERAGQTVMASLKSLIEKRLKLQVNANKSKVAKPQDRTFLSFKLWRLKSGKVYVLVSDKALRRFRDELKRMTPRNWGQSLDDCIRRLSLFLRGWLGYFAIRDRKQHAHLGRIDAHLRRRLRAIVLKHWKRKRHIVSHLIGQGVAPRLVRVRVHGRRRSWWALSGLKAVGMGLTNGFFARRGLYSLHEHRRPNHDRIWDIGPTQLPLQVA